MDATEPPVLLTLPSDLIHRIALGLDDPQNTQRLSVSAFASTASQISGDSQVRSLVASARELLGREGADPFHALRRLAERLVVDREHGNVSLRR